MTFNDLQASLFKCDFFRAVVQQLTRVQRSASRSPSAIAELLDAQRKQNQNASLSI